MAFPARILLLEDTPSDAELIAYRLQKGGAEDVCWVDDLKDFEHRLEEDFDVIVSDYRLRGFGGTEALRIAKLRNPHQAFVVCSGYVGDEEAADVIKGGADDFVSKDNIYDRLNITVERAYENAIIKEKEHEGRKSLALSTQQLTSIVNNIQESVLLLEYHESKKDEIVLVRINPSFIKLISRFNSNVSKLREAPNIPLFSFLHRALLLEPDRTQLWRNQVEKVLQEGVSVELNENVLLDDGRRYVLEINMIPVILDAEKKAFQCLVFIKNATQQVLTEKYILSSIIQAQERERMRMAHELHDGIGQYLSAAVLNLNAMADDEKQMSGPGRTRLNEALKRINTAISEARSIAHNLVPKAIEDFGLEAAIGSMLDSIAGLGKLEVHFNSNLGGERLEQEIEINLFRVCQESISNILKHSEAKRVNVQLLQYPDALNMTIEDDGVGFDAKSELGQPSKSGIGLNGMANRVKSVGGEIEISSSPGRGTNIMINLPLNHKTLSDEKNEHTAG